MVSVLLVIENDARAFIGLQILDMIFAPSDISRVRLKKIFTRYEKYVQAYVSRLGGQF